MGEPLRWSGQMKGADCVQAHCYRQLRPKEIARNSRWPFGIGWRVSYSSWFVGSMSQSCRSRSSIEVANACMLRALRLLPQVRGEGLCIGPEAAP